MGPGRAPTFWSTLGEWINDCQTSLPAAYTYPWMYRHNNKPVMSTFAVEVKCEPVLEAARNDIEDVLSGRTQIDWQKQVAANRLNDGQRILVQVSH